MEKSWENFWTTGKVEDYLTYRNRVTENEKDSENRKEERQNERESKWDSRLW